MLHFHIHAALFQFIQHLVQPFLHSLRAFGTQDPCQGFVLLVIRPCQISMKEIISLKGLFYIIRHGYSLASLVGRFRVHYCSTHRLRSIVCRPLFLLHPIFSGGDGLAVIQHFTHLAAGLRRTDDAAILHLVDHAGGACVADA